MSVVVAAVVSVLVVRRCSLTFDGVVVVHVLLLLLLPLLLSLAQVAMLSLLLLVLLYMHPPAPPSWLGFFWEFLFSNSRLFRCGFFKIIHGI